MSILLRRPPLAAGLIMPKSLELVTWINMRPKSIAAIVRTFCCSHSLTFVLQPCKHHNSITSHEINIYIKVMLPAHKGRLLVQSGHH